MAHSIGCFHVMSESRGNGRGKIILLGEHAVVHGVKALVVGLDRGATARVSRHERDEIALGGSRLTPDHELYLALAAARQALASAPVRLDLELDIPAGAGLGASAALGVATARALLGELVDEAAVASAADAWERVLHGNPSGVDRTAAQLGGVLAFTKHQPPEPVPLRRALHLVCAIAGPPASTKDMVQMVAALRTSNPIQFEKNLAAIGSLVENAALCLRGGDLVSLGKLMDLCQMVLAGWMLSTEAIEVACKVARTAGALGAKLTGSGGGGAIVALAEDPAIAQRVQAALSAQNLPAFSCRVDPDLDSHAVAGGHAHD
jgi:mevalonate kinase